MCENSRRSVWPSKIPYCFHREFEILGLLYNVSTCILRHDLHVTSHLLGQRVFFRERQLYRGLDSCVLEAQTSR